MPVPHLLVAISSHGYGHLTQVVPIINLLLKQIPELTLTLRTDLPEEVLRNRIQGNFNRQSGSDDFGLVMFDAMRVDRKASFQRYVEMHTNWEKRVEQCAQELVNTGANLVLADVPYMTLAAAKEAGIPSLAICSLNWFDIARNYFPDNQVAREILEKMAAAYQAADVFLQPEPTMPMDWLSNRKAIGPVASPGTRRRKVLQEVAGIKPDEQVILMAMGGIPMHLDIDAWQPTKNMHLIITPGWKAQYPRVHYSTDMGLNFQDLLASSDLVLTKPGYGTFVEAAAAGLPLLHFRRPDWPETPYLESWLDSKVNQQSIDLETYSLNAVIESCHRLLEAGKRPAIEMKGVVQAVELLSGLLIKQ